MIRAAVFGLCLALAAPAAVAGVAEDAASASAALQASVAALDEAQGAKDRVAALTATIRAYECIHEMVRRRGGALIPAAILGREAPQ